MRKHLTDTILMIRPDTFGFNPETAATNAFQHSNDDAIETVRQKALEEFTGMVNTLLEKGVNVTVVASPQKHHTPDAVFPNNWISFHSDDGGKVVVYPMLAPNRRLERQLSAIRGALNVPLAKIEDLTAYEAHDKFLEGTGSLVLAREAGVAFAVLSPRTHEMVVTEFCERLGYEPVLMHAVGNGMPVYHTNVVMSIGKEFAVVCLSAIVDPQERKMVKKKIETLGLTLIDITTDQMDAFCANILQVKNKDGTSLIVMSQTAFDAFRSEQKKQLSKYGELVPVSIPTIEQIGGGSARCMMAEVFV